MPEAEAKKTWMIEVDAFQSGVLMALLSDYVERMKRKGQPKAIRAVAPLYERLKEISKEIRKESGVTVEYLPGGKVLLQDRSGFTIIRNRYPWEDGGL